MTKYLTLLLTCLCIQPSFAQQWVYTLTLSPAKVHVSLQIKDNTADSLVFRMPTWTPGYYQHIQFPERVSNFKVFNSKDPLPMHRLGTNGWCVMNTTTDLRIEYDVRADSDFVAAAYVDSTRALLNLTGICMYTNIQQPVILKVITPDGWSVATGLDFATGQEATTGMNTANSQAATSNINTATGADKTSPTFIAPDFDILYDSPLLCGPLDSLPSFKVRGIPHYFVGLHFVDFDRAAFMRDMQKIVTAAADMMGDIPYTHYTFLSFGNGHGGIEHLNSTTVPWTGERKNYNFLAHEYFHHYNVKRIRPVELGPFDYDNGNKTKMLWVAEGLTVYYEYLIVHRAGLSTANDVLKDFTHNLLAYETKTGKLHQSLAQSSLATWEEGPFGGDGISYYDKGPLIGLLLDIKIRQATNNKKSLDDVMRGLYKTYYKEHKRGYTEQEFRQLCENTAGTKLDELFDYVNTTKEVDYNKYLHYAGLKLDLKTFEFSRVNNPDAMQNKIYSSIF